jgi:hypothetical protein
MSLHGDRVQAWLESFLVDHGGLAGSVHAIRGDQLELRASVNIPDPVIAVTRVIPKGKGMAGLAWERRAPVSTCNLKTDTSGDVRPGARAVDAQAAVSLPVSSAGGDVTAVVGIAFRDERELSDGDLDRLQRAAGSVGELL